MVGPTNVDLSALQLTVAENQSQLPRTCRSAIPGVLSLPEKQTNRLDNLQYFYYCQKWELFFNI